MSDIYRDSIFWVEIERIKPNPFQPRREFDQAKLTELAESIRMYGLLQPLTVTKKEMPREDGGISVEYELIAGERRLRASKLAGIQQLPVIIRTGENSDQEKLELAIIENLQREDLNPVDRARAFYDLHKKFGFTHSEIGKKMGKSREYVSNTLRLLTLPEAILIYIAEGRISEGHTRPLMMLNSRPEEQTVLVKEILLKKLTVRETEAIARRVAQDRVTERHKIDPTIISVERALTERLGTRVTIEPREVGGRLVISFFSADDLQALLDSMRIEDDRVTVTNVFNGTGAEEVAAVEAAINAPEEVVLADAGDTVAVPEGVVVAEQGLDDSLLDQAVDEVAQEEAFRSAGFQVAAVAPEDVQEVALPQDDVQQAEEVAQLSEVKNDPEEVPSERPQAFAGVFDSILGSLSPREGRVERVKQEEAAERASTPPIPSVVPSADRPMPERTSASEDGAEKQEDESDLYSIRNFSI